VADERSIRKVADPNDGQGRVETGDVQFGDDWPGLFIRGDNAFALALAVKRLQKHFEDKPPDNLDVMLAMSELNGLFDIIRDDVDLSGVLKT
jgi:hypothetical protein